MHIQKVQQQLIIYENRIININQTKNGDAFGVRRNCAKPNEMTPISIVTLREQKYVYKKPQVTHNNTLISTATNCCS